MTRALKSWCSAEVTQGLFTVFHWQLSEPVVAERGCSMDNVHSCNRANLQ